MRWIVGWVSGAVGLAAAAAAQAPQNGVAVVYRTSAACAGAAASSAAVVDGSWGQPLTGVSEAAAASLHAGQHAPPVDRFGAIVLGRIVDWLSGRSLQLDAVAADAAGNRDGRLDVADLVVWIARRLP